MLFKRLFEQPPAESVATTETETPPSTSSANTATPPMNVVPAMMNMTLPEFTDLLSASLRVNDFLSEPGGPSSNNVAPDPLPLDEAEEEALLRSDDEGYDVCGSRAIPGMEGVAPSGVGEGRFPPGVGGNQMPNIGVGNAPSAGAINTLNVVRKSFTTQSNLGENVA